MGDKGSKLSQDATDVCARFVQDLAPMGDINSRKMFGGYGIFESGAMFALINSQGNVYLKADDSNRWRFEQAGAEQHGRMPDRHVSAEVLDDTDVLREWARISIEVADASKKK